MRPAVFLLFCGVLGLELVDQCTTVEDFDAETEQINANNLNNGESFASFGRSLDESVFLGSGAFGTVKKVRLRGKEMAVKRLELRGSRSSASRELGFLKMACGAEEVGAISSCDSSSIAEFWGCVVDDDTVFFLQQPMDGDFEDRRILAAYRAGGRRVRAATLAGLARAVWRLNERGVVHADLKPANVLGSLKRKFAGDSKNEEGEELAEVRLTDLGGACGRSEIPPDGTALYSSPERLNGQPISGPGADLYALALTFAAFEGPLESELLQINSNCFEAMDVGCHAQVLAVVQRIFNSRGLRRVGQAAATAAAFDPEERYSSAEEFAKAIEEAIDDDEREPIESAFSEKESADTRGTSKGKSRLWGDEKEIKEELIEETKKSKETRESDYSGGLASVLFGCCAPLLGPMKKQPRIVLAQRSQKEGNKKRENSGNEQEPLII